MHFFFFRIFVINLHSLYLSTVHFIKNLLNKIRLEKLDIAPPMKMLNYFGTHLMSFKKDVRK